MQDFVATRCTTKRWAEEQEMLAHKQDYLFPTKVPCVANEAARE